MNSSVQADRPPATRHVPAVVAPGTSGAARVPSTPPATIWIVVAGLATTLVWCYWTTLETMAQRWATEPQYSHGFLVPLFALAVLVLRRPATLPTWEPSWWGVPVCVAALTLRFFAAELDIQALDGISMLAMITGVVLLVGGERTLRWCWPSIAYLAFMLPLPFAVEVWLSHPLQRIATTISTFCLQTLGFPALAEGNVIHMDQIELRVVHACSGLSMLMTFFALSTAMALVLDGPLADRLVLLVSAIPIAVIANVTRITATGVAYYHLGSDSEVARAIMHDMAGWLMMPLAFALLWFEWQYLHWLLPPAQQQEPLLAYTALEDKR